MATIPDALPPEYAAELMKLQSEAPPMGWAFVKRRMAAELGPHWQKKFLEFKHHPAAAASLGQVHRARSHDGAELACKLQYPDMQSAVEADLRQLQLIFAIHRRMDPVIDTTEIAKEIGARIREELDYRREAKHVMLYRRMLEGIEQIRVPRVWPELSTGRLLTLDWLEGRRLLEHTKADLATRNRLGTAMFTAWWWSFSRFGVIHGDPHLGNYTVFDVAGRPAGINLLDYGCMRIFPPKFVGGVVDLYHGLLKGDADLIVRAYETWGFKRLSRANSCSWTGPRSGSARCFCICAPSSISTSCSMKPSRIFQFAASPSGRPRRSRPSASKSPLPSVETSRPFNVQHLFWRPNVETVG